MNRRSPLQFLAPIAIAGLLSVSLAGSVWAELRESPKEVVDEVWQIVHREYVDTGFNELDWQERRSELLARNYVTEEDAYDTIRELLTELNDPFTRFLDPDTFAAMQIDTAGELTGVGMQLGTDEETEEIIVIAPTDGSPAAAAGNRAGDILVGIDGESTTEMDINEAVNLIRGPVGTTVTITMRRDSEEIDFPLIRAVISLPVVRFERRQEGSRQVGYIRLSQFSAHAAEEMEAAVESLETDGVDGYVLDLRSNPGGLLFASTEIARMFMDEGAIVLVADREGVRDRVEANNSAISDRPMVVLVNGSSASASEILAGALQDNDRATLVGTQTFGKGSVQSVHRLSGGAGLTVTTARYRTPSGRDIHRKGIEPDIVVDLSPEDIVRLNETPDAIGTQADPQYRAALRALRLPIAGI